MSLSKVDFISALQKILRKDGLIKKHIGNHTMYMDPKDRGLSATLINQKPGGPEREACFMKIIRQEIAPGMVTLDIGANIGYVTLIMAGLVGPSGKVFAIEPDSQNFGILTKNIEVNGYANVVIPFQIGVSNVSGVSRFYLSDKSNLHSMTPTKHTNSWIDITLETIDEFMKDKGCPEFIKMDIEGHEVEALDGMFNTLQAASSPVKILIEVHPMYYSETHSLEKQLRRLIDIDFNTKYVVSAGVAKPDFFAKHGYEPTEVIFTDGWYRGIYTNVSNEHMLTAACHEHRQFIKEKNQHVTKIVRSIVIEKSVPPDYGKATDKLGGVR